MTNGLKRQTMAMASAAPALCDSHVPAMRAIEDLSTVIRLKRGDRLELGPERPKVVYLVRSGHLVLWAELTSRRHVAVALYSPGNIVRASELPPLRAIAAVASAPCQVLRAGEAAFNRLINHCDEVSAYCAKETALQSVRDKAHIILMCGLSGEERVASFFVEMAQRLGRRNGSIIAVEIPFSRSDIANFLALNPDTLSRIFSRWKTMGLMRSSGRRSVEILDLAGLTALAPGTLGLLDEHRADTAASLGRL